MKVVEIELQRVFYEETPKFNDILTLIIKELVVRTMNLLDQFGFGNYSPAVTFLMILIYDDMLRLQAIELNDQIRKSIFISIKK